MWGNAGGGPLRLRHTPTLQLSSATLRMPRNAIEACIRETKPLAKYQRATKVESIRAKLENRWHHNTKEAGLYAYLSTSDIPNECT